MNPRHLFAESRQRVATRLTAAREHVRAARRWEQGQRTLLDQLAPDWTEHTADAYVIGAGDGQTWTRTLVVRDWPPRVTAGWLAPLLFDLGGDVQLVQHVDQIPTGAAVNRLRAQRVVQASVAQARLERGAIPDPGEQLDLASAEEIARAVAAGEEQLFSVGMYFCLRASTLPELDALERRVRERLLALGVTLSSARWQHAAGFRTAGVLYAVDRLGRRRTLDTTTLALSLPFLTSHIGTEGGPQVAVCLADRGPTPSPPVSPSRSSGTPGCAWARLAGASVRRTRNATLWPRPSRRRWSVWPWPGGCRTRRTAAPSVTPSAGRSSPSGATS